MIVRSLFILASLAGLAGDPAQAIGFGRVPSNVPLGSQLSFPVSVQLGPEETLTAQCVTAEVTQGEQRVLPSNVRTLIEPGAVPDERIVRVQSLVAIEEPVVSITVTLGCINKVERRFTVFADPPLVTLAAAPPDAPPAEPPSPPPAPEVPASAPASPASAPASPAGATAPASAPIAPTPPAVRRTTRPTVTRDPGTAVGTTRAAGAAPVVRAASAPAASRPRLKLDPIEPVSRAAVTASAAQEAALRVAAMAASAALAEQAASTARANEAAAAERMRAVEAALEKMRADAQRDREQLAQMRSNLAAGESMRRMLPWLVLGLALLAALALWLWWRLRRVQRQQQAQWWAAAQAASRQPPANPPTLQPMTLPPHLAPTPPARPMTPAPQPSTSAARPSAFGASSTLFPDSMMAQPARDVSIEELIDLEQQAEFFVVLGQDDAAIDLLMGHIRSSGGTSPLPYLKLLEIYRRLGDRESYERTRARFNHRFNAYAPDWDVDLQQGRSLDEYPGIMQRLERVWPSPMDAMAELEALMFRRDRGELFELPAYRELLFLYSMARDLLDHQGGPNTTIDVLLPLSEASFETTTAHPHLITMSTMGGLSGMADLGRAAESPVTALNEAIKPTPAHEDPSSEFGVVDLDLTKPLPMFENPGDAGGRADEQHSDFLDLPPPAPRKR